ncbi:MAG: DUF4172 domain-containing protein [Spirochaetes bacterium]|nr:DUF4172 domain-containing protein [Spirochaetota bacterium]
MKKYIYEQSGYPEFTWDNGGILNILTRVAGRQGAMLGKMQQLGFDIRQEAMLRLLNF